MASNLILEPDSELGAGLGWGGWGWTEQGDAWEALVELDWRLERRVCAWLGWAGDLVGVAVCWNIHRALVKNAT